MEATTLKSKKQAISKGKIKKTLKNIICRPDEIVWPILPENYQDSVKCVLNEYKIQQPKFTKFHWKQLKHIPKDQRPKPPKLDRVEGFIFGISECLAALEKDECSAILIESSVNPRSILQSVLDTCIRQRLPAVCINGLKNLCLSNFGIPTSCLGVKKEFLTTISKVVLEASQNIKKSSVSKNVLLDTTDLNKSNMQEDIEMTEMSKHIKENVSSPYLYRKSKKERVFVPPDSCKTILQSNDFSGQNFIKLPSQAAYKTKIMDRNSYMKMIVKKVSNNPSRKSQIKKTG